MRRHLTLANVLVQASQAVVALRRVCPALAYAQRLQDSVDEEHAIEALAQRLDLLNILTAVRSWPLAGEDGVKLAVVDHGNGFLFQLFCCTKNVGFLRFDAANVEMLIARM